MSMTTRQPYPIGLWIASILAVSVCAAGVPCPAGAAAGDEKALARQILADTGVKGGLVIHVGCGDGRLTAALRAGHSFLVHGLDTNAANVEKARSHVQSLGLYGNVSIDRQRGTALPYIDNLVNLVVAEDLGKTPVAEVMRILAPGGVAYVKQNGAWKKTVKPRPSEIDEWTHYLHGPGNNAVAHDSVVGPPRRLQWVGSPRWSRHHDHMSSVSGLVSSGGRLFTIFDEGPRSSIALPAKWSLIARDAFNGTILWKRPISKWYTHYFPLKSGPALLPRRLVAVGNTVYATLGLDAPLSALDAATGETIRTYTDTAATEEILACDGLLILSVNRDPKDAEYANMQEVKSLVRAPKWSGGNRSIMAVEANSGNVLWQGEHFVIPLTLAADSERVFFHDGERIVCLDRKSGDRAWASKPIARTKAFPSYYAPTLVVYKDVVLFAGGETFVPHRGAKDTMTALSAKTGETLWTADHPPSGYQSPEDILVADGLVWSGATTSGGYDGVFTGRDPRTGEVKREFAPDVQTYWFHHRCHRGKATDKYLLMSRTGIEFLDVRKNQWEIHHWVRGACLYGIMPCNGLIYAPQHPCACYPEAKLYGFNAVAPAAEASKPSKAASDDNRLERGPAYGSEISNLKSKISDADWPTYRCDNTRSGFTKTAVPAALKRTWERDLGGRLSSVVIAGGKLFVASIDTHTVHALGADSGKPLWSYTAGARVDSPPTIHQGRVLFGSADGWVYCLRADDGVLAWRFRAAPDDRRLTSFEQVESVWPVHGSILVQNGVAYFAAGRSMFLDGGLRLYRLDPKTGRKLSETILDDRDPATGKNLQVNIKTLNMPVALPDILSSDGRWVFMKSQRFDLDGKRLEIGPHSGNPAEQGAVQRGEGAHVFCPSGFLDGTWWHRTYWVYGRSFAGGHAGYHQAGKFAPAGRILTFDDSSVYAYGRKPQYYRWTTPIEHQLFATDKEAPDVGKPAAQGGGSMIRFAISESLNPAGKPLAVEAWVKAAKPSGVILARGGPSHGYALLVQGGRPRFTVRISNEVSQVTAKEKILGKWVHLAGVLTADKQLQIYVDGKLAASAKAPGFIASDPKQAMEIGADDAGNVGDYRSPFTFTGLIDEVRVYHGTVTADEIRKHCATPGDAAAKDATLVLACSFDKGDAKDESGNKNHGQVGSVHAAKGKVGDAMKFTGRAARGGGSRVTYRWNQDTPLLVRAMVLAAGTLFVAGPPDLVDEEEVFRNLSDPAIQAKLADQVSALQGQKGALLWAVSASDGKKLAEYTLDTVPAWDGMAAARGRLYFSTIDGRVICMGGK